ncbi:MAG: CopG family transcriptional regulator [Xanthomonadales bacterium]|nr:CopG family transcriptional regulator [Xanthomonadales bacterium]
MNTLSVKLPSDLDEAIAAASALEHISKSTLVRRALEAYLARRDSRAPQASSLDKAGDLVGCFKGGPRDLASNPAHLAGFGRT